MTQHSHQTAPTQFVEANGIRFAYRRFGKAPDFDPELFIDGIDPPYWAELNAAIGGVPLVFNQHFTGTMDHWDPAERATMRGWCAISDVSAVSLTAPTRTGSWSATGCR